MSRRCNAGCKGVGLTLSVGMTLSVALASALAVAPGKGFADACTRLDRLPLADATVASAETVPAGPIEIGPARDADTTSVQAPAFCRVKGVAAGAVGYEVWLPRQGWNGRLLSVGNGGFGGAVPIPALADGLVKGYAVTGNDTGHQGQDRAWMHDRGRVRLWGHSATHMVTGPAKALVRAYYGRPARFAYFSGCSTGGAQAMEEAEFYPQDYDGVLAGAPGMSYTHLMLSFLWGLKAADRPGALLTPAKLVLLHAAVLQACAPPEGLKYGLVDDPLACHFDPARLRCRAGDAPDCLTPAQVETARMIYQGPRNPRTGRPIYPGFALGSEADSRTGGASPFAYGWSGVQGPLAVMFAIPLLRDMVYQDPTWDWRRFDWDRDVADLDRRISGDITAVDPDLRAFARRGGRLILYQGWGDPLNAQTLPIHYRNQVVDVFAGGGAGEGRAEAERRVDGFLRVFMVPGMGHCTGGPGPSRFDALSALRAWVERGRAPSRLLADHVSQVGGGGSAVAYSRPLCPYPQVALWTGRSDPDRAASYTCRRPRP